MWERIHSWDTWPEFFEMEDVDAEVVSAFGFYDLLLVGKVGRRTKIDAIQNSFQLVRVSIFQWRVIAFIGLERRKSTLDW